MLQKTKPKIFPKSLRTRLLKAECFTEIAKKLFFFFLYQHIYTQLQHKKVMSPDTFYLVFPGVK